MTEDETRHLFEELRRIRRLLYEIVRILAIALGGVGAWFLSKRLESDYGLGAGVTGTISLVLVALSLMYFAGDRDK